MTKGIQTQRIRRLGVAEAKSKLSEVLRDAAQGPTIIHSRGVVGERVAMAKKSRDSQAANRILSSWDEIVKCLGEFPSSETLIEFDVNCAEPVSEKRPSLPAASASARQRLATLPEELKALQRGTRPPEW